MKTICDDCGRDAGGLVVHGGHVCCAADDWSFCTDCCLHPRTDDDARRDFRMDTERAIKRLIEISYDIHKGSMPHTSWTKDKWCQHLWNTFCGRNMTTGIEDQIAAPAAQSKYLSYAIVNGSLVVVHPLLMPHEISLADGKWYIYPISPRLEKLRDVKFRHDAWRPDLEATS